MSHEISFDINGKAQMAYVNETPWHGLGQKLTPKQPIEVWAQEAGMNFTIQDTPVMYTNGSGGYEVYSGRKILLRDDTRDTLAIVGSGYNVVQPLEVLEFFRDLTESQGFELETAGVLFNGSKYWALARAGEDLRVGGAKSKDIMRPYLMLATACDGTLQTTAQFTSVRVVCQNTLTAAVLNRNDKIGAIKVSHRSQFDATEMKEKLGLASKWSDFVARATELSKIKVSKEQAADFVRKLLDPGQTKDAEKFYRAKQVQQIIQLFDGRARGAELTSANGTAWGLVNAITEHVDHIQGKDQSNRLYYAWFYDGNRLKQKAFEQAFELAA